MELEVYTQDATEIKGVLDVYSSLRFRRKYHEPGEFEIHLPDIKKNISLLRADYLLHSEQRQETGVVESIELKDDELTIKGRLLSCCLDNCYIDRVYNFYNESYGNVVKTLIDNHAKKPYLNPLLNIKSICQGEQKVSTQISHKDLLDVLITLSKTSNIGFKVYLNPLNKSWDFVSFIGVDRSVTQTDNPSIIFSDEYGNLTGETYTFDKTKYKNHALVLGEGEGDARVKVYLDAPKYETEPRRYMIIDAKDVRKEDGISDSAYQELLRNRGLEKLAENAVVENFDADAATGVQWEYLNDWDLGDIVTIESKAWGISINKRITEIEEVYENGITKIIPTFGTPQPETLSLD